MQTLSITAYGQGWEELFLGHAFEAGQGKSVSLRTPGHPVYGQWTPEDARSAWTGKTQGWPRTRLWRRYVAGRGTATTLAMSHRQPRSGAFLDGVGPMRSRIRTYPEKEWAPIPGKQYGPRQPWSDTPMEDGTYNPSVDAPGGRWISPYQGTGPAKSWFATHVRTMDRCSVAATDPALEAMLVNGKTKVARWSVQARKNPDMSKRPDGKVSTVPTGFLGIGDWRKDPMYPWLGGCGNAGYNGAHLIRQYRAALAMAWLFDDDAFQQIAAADIGAMAREVAWTLSPYPSMDTPTGGTGWVNYQPLAFRPVGTVGPDNGRTNGWYAHILACAMALGHRSEFLRVATDYLSWFRDSLAPSGFIQAVKYDETGGPQPKDCGVLAHELSAAEIEAPIAVGGFCSLSFQVFGPTIPSWLSLMLDKLCMIYLRTWPVGTPPAWGKYWVHGEKGGIWYGPDQVRMCPTGPRSTFNAWWLLECGLRFGSPSTQTAIRARRPEIEALWANESLRPWMAGLAGALA